MDIAELPVIANEVRTLKTRVEQAEAAVAAKENEVSLARQEVDRQRKALNEYAGQYKGKDAAAIRALVGLEDKSPAEQKASEQKPGDK
jgi:outer membrane protein TolC